MSALIKADAEGWRKIQVFSDLHLGHIGSSISGAQELAPAISDASHIVFNGDTVEARSAANKPMVDSYLAGLHSLADAQRKILLLTGNHDPEISANHGLTAANGQVLIMHGDAVFPALSPWSNEAQALKQSHCNALAAAEQNAPLPLADRLALSRRVAMEAPIMDWAVGNKRSPMKLILRQLMNPLRLVRILKCWQQAATVTASFLAKYAPQAQYAIVGHTHWQGVWRVNGRVIINLGGFLPAAGRRTALITSEEIQIFSLVKVGSEFHLGKQVATLPLVPNDLADS